MEATENKIIIAKLETLNSLPKDYQPNLNSKWALLEASLSGENKGKQRLLFWMRAAAALIILGVAGLWMQSENKVKGLADTKTNIVAESKSANSAEPVSKQQPALQLQNELNVAEKFKVTTPPAKRIETVEKNQTVNEPIKAIVTLPVISSTEEPLSSVIKEPTQIATISEMPTKKKKGRYVQLDFDDSIGEAPLNSPEQTLLVKNIKISLLKSHYARSTNPTTPHEAIFKINF